MLGFATLTASGPHLSLRRLRVGGLAVALALGAVFGTAGTALAWDPGTFSGADEGLLFSLTNQDRASAGLNALVDDGYLHKEAEWRAQDMGDRNFFSHAIPPDNRMVFSYMQADGYCFAVAGENIGLTTFGDSDATASLEVAFMGSPTHRDNILGTWAHMSVGAYKAADGRKLYSVLFSIPCGVSVPAPTPVPTPVPVATPVPVPVATPVPVPVATPVPVPTTRPAATPAPTATPVPSPSAVPSPSSSPTPQPPTPAPTVVPSATTGPTAAPAAPTPGSPTSLRVHEKTTSGGPIDSLFNSLFGGLFGW